MPIVGSHRKWAHQADLLDVCRTKGSHGLRA
jgi:hypothetical protein